MTRQYHSKKRAEASMRHHYAILRAAMDEFSQHGYHAARLEDITSKAGLSKGSLYNHFKNKQHLFISVIDWGEHQLQEQLRSIRNRTRNPRECLESSLRLYLRFYEKRVDFFKVLVQEKHQFSDGIKRRYIDQFYKDLQEYEHVIRSGIEDGTFRDIDPALGMLMVIGVANSLLFNWMHFSSETKINKLFNQAIDFIKHGMYQNSSELLSS